MCLYMLILGPPTLLWGYISGNDAFLYRVARGCICIAGWICGIKVALQGQDKVLSGVTYVFLSNHQGNFDGPVLIHSIPRNLKALIKLEMMRLPVLSWALKQAQFVPIDRRNPKNAHIGIDCGARLLTEGKSFFAFPEGTRSRDGSMGEFKKGVFIMALKAQIPVMPITIIGSASIQPPGSYAIHPGTIRIIFHDAIETAGMGMEDRNRLVQLTRAAIASALESTIENRS
jgi:1-acyl-sn-glycerol-3-phosphate acyltransferase